MGPKRFSDFASEEGALDGQKVKMESILNKEILILGYRVKDSKYEKKNSGICLTIQFEMDGKKAIVFTGSTVLADQLNRYKDQIPFLGIVLKVDRYFTFS